MLQKVKNLQLKALINEITMHNKSVYHIKPIRDIQILRMYLNELVAQLKPLVLKLCDG